MKKLFVLCLLLVLVGCEEEPVKEDPKSDCYSENVEVETYCEAFDSISLFGYDVVYDITMYESRSTNVDWMEVLYQYPDFYNRLLPYVDSLEFDDSDMTFEVMDVFGVDVIYTDHNDNTHKKSFFVEIRDAGVVQIPNGDFVHVVEGGFVKDMGNAILTIDTHKNGMFVLLMEYDDGFEWYLKEYIYRHAEIPVYSNLQVEISKMYLGIKVELVLINEDESKSIVDAYYVMHNDYIINSETILDDGSEEGVITNLPTKDGLTYQVLDLVVNTTTQDMEVTFQILDGETILFSEVVILENENDFLILDTGDIAYSVQITRYGLNKMIVSLFSDEYNHQIQYTNIPNN